MPTDYRILRFPLELQEYQELTIGWPAEVLSVALGKDGNIDLWAVVIDEDDSRRRPVTVPIYIVGTGRPIPREVRTEPRIVADQGGYLGTVVMDRLGDRVGDARRDGHVWHIWTGRQRT
jgi:hypothetical protein